jgi:hypothetical protein
MRELRRWLVPLVCVVLASCATLGQGIQAPSFAVAEEQPAELRLLAPSAARPLGGATVRLWARVGNPNPFGLTLSTVAGRLVLENTQAADVEFPLGVPLAAGQTSVVPLEISVNLADVPNLATALMRAVTGQQLGYELIGRVGVDAGLLGQPTFGPMTLLSGNVQVRQ